MQSATASQAAKDLAETIDEALWFGTDDPSVPEEDAKASVAAEVARVSGLKPFPAVAQRVLSELSKPQFSVPRVANLVESDPALTSMVLRVVNSALYGRGPACRSAEHAIVRLGARRIRDVVAGAATMQMFDNLKGIGRTFRNHCAATAAVVRVLGQHRDIPGAEDLFLAGLLHDVGKLLLLETREFDYTAVPPEQLSRPNGLHPLEREKLGYDHAVLGAHVMRAWTIPDPIPQIVAWHHQPVRAYGAGGAIAAQVSLLRIADTISWYLAHSLVASPKFLTFLANGADASWVELGESAVQEMWPRLIEARAEALEIFTNGTG